MTSLESITNDIQTAAAESNPRERFRRVNAVEERVRGSQVFSSFEGSELVTIVDSLRQFFTDVYDRVREVGAKLATLAVVEIKNDDYSSVQEATSHILPTVGNVLSGGEAVEKHEEVRLAFLHLIGALISKDDFWKQDLSRRFMPALVSPVVVSLSDPAPVVKEIACKHLLQAVRKNPDFARYAASGTLNGLKSCINSKFHSVQMLAMKALGAVVSKGGALFDIPQACELVAQTALSDSFGVKLVFLHVSAELMINFHDNDEVHKILLPAFLPLLRDGNQQLVDEAKTQWKNVGSVLGAHGGDEKTSEDACDEIVDRYKKYLVELFCENLIGRQLNRNSRLAAVTGLRVVAQHVPAQLPGLSHLLVEALTFGFSDEDDQIRLQCALLAEVVGHMVPVKIWIAILEGLALACLGHGNAKHELGRPILLCSIALKGTNGEGLLEKIEDDVQDRTALDVLLGILSLPTQTGLKRAAEDVGKCILTVFGYLMDTDVPGNAWYQLLKLVLKTLPLMHKDSELMKELELMLPNFKNIEQYCESLFRSVETAECSRVDDPEWIMFEMLFSVCKNQAINRYDAIMRVCGDVASREESDRQLVLRCFKIVATAAKASVQEWPITDRRVDDFARLVKLFIIASALPALNQPRTASGRVMQSAAVELILEVTGTGRVFGDKVESFELALCERIAMVVAGHPRAETRCKAQEILKRRVRFFGPDQHKFLTEAVFPIVFEALDDKAGEPRRMAMKTLVEIGRSFQLTSELPQQEKCKLLYRALELCKVLSEHEDDKYFPETKATVEALSDFTTKLMKVDEASVRILSDEYAKMVADMNRQVL